MLTLSIAPLTKAGFAPFGEVVVKYSPVEGDLLFRRQGRGRQYARTQLWNGDRCRPTLADHDCPCRIRSAHSRLEVGTHCEHRGKNRNDRIAGAGDVADTNRISRDVNR
jgi:hypothetical protein